MPAPKNPNTGPATDARKLQPGEMSEKYRIRGRTELHTWLASLTPSQIGELLSDIRGGVYGPYKRFG